MVEGRIIIQLRFWSNDITGEDKDVADPATDMVDEDANLAE